jgi:hypothetical protein
VWVLAVCPKAIFSMGKLKVLHLHYNEIPLFPTELDKLKHLTGWPIGFVDGSAHCLQYGRQGSMRRERRGSDV